MDLDLAGKVAIITGGSRGIGAATAHRLAQAGAAVVIAARTAEDLRVRTAEIEAAGGKALAVTANVGHPADLDRLVNEAIRAFGGVDILVNNAAVSPDSKPIQDVSIEE
jgi:NAD(P)-dependent dehydrogenase (short-subunit alcohol dehydrogenase family)